MVMTAMIYSGILIESLTDGANDYLDAWSCCFCEIYDRRNASGQHPALKILNISEPSQPHLLHVSNLQINR